MRRYQQLHGKYLHGDFELVFVVELGELVRKRQQRLQRLGELIESTDIGIEIDI